MLNANTTSLQHQRCLLHPQNGNIQQAVLPIQSKSVKSMMYAFIALAPDGHGKKLADLLENEPLLLGCMGRRSMRG
ncbi:MAG: Na(+)-translocating NADH-quinone reductase subunit C [Sodalis sp.]|nr:MAG: Na(+)-translocating NADH-quinone reductase subunit C [Sodalis sp.]